MEVASQSKKPIDAVEQTKPQSMPLMKGRTYDDSTQTTNRTALNPSRSASRPGRVSK